MRLSRGGGGRWEVDALCLDLVSVLHGKRIFCITSFSMLMILFASLQITSSWIQALDKA